MWLSCLPVAVVTRRQIHVTKEALEAAALMIVGAARAASESGFECMFTGGKQHS